MADPPGADGVIQAGGFWDGTTYTPPAGLIPVIDPTTDAGMVQVAAHKMMDVFDAAFAAHPGQPHRRGRRENVENAINGIHWQIVAAARIGLNATRTAVRRVKFMEECASWPDGRERRRCAVRRRDDRCRDGAPIDFNEKWSWVKP